MWGSVNCDLLGREYCPWLTNLAEFNLITRDDWATVVNWTVPSQCQTVSFHFTNCRFATRIRWSYFCLKYEIQKNELLNEINENYLQLPVKRSGSPCQIRFRPLQCTCHCHRPWCDVEWAMQHRPLVSSPFDRQPQTLCPKCIKFQCNCITNYQQTKNSVSYYYPSVE